MLLQFALIVVGLVLLIKGADFLVDGSSSIAKRVNVSDIVIGLTIVSFGTSAPELVVNLLSATAGNVDLAMGNVIGSSIANVLLILGVAGLVRELTVKKGTVWKEVPLMLLAGVALLVLANDVVLDGSTTSTVSRIDGIVLLLFFAIFMYYTYGISKATSSNGADIKKRSLGVAVAMIGGGGVGLVIGGKLIVDNAVILATGFGVSQALIGLTIVAIGTSLPELATSVVAALKGKADIAVGNAVGSNIFNILFVLGITATIVELPYSSSLNFDTLVMLAAFSMLFLVMFIGKKRRLQRWQAAGLILLYFAYTAFLTWRG